MTRLRAASAVLAVVVAVLVTLPGTAEASSSWAWPMHGPHRVLGGLDPPALVGAGRVRLLPLGGPAGNAPTGAVPAAALALVCVGTVRARRRVSRRRSSSRRPEPRPPAGRR